MLVLHLISCYVTYCATLLETEALKNFEKMLKAFTDVTISLENGIKVTFNGSLLEYRGGLLNTVTGGLELWVVSILCFCTESKGVLV